MAENGSVQDVLDRADALASSDLSEAHVDIQSLAASYRARRESGDERAAFIHGRSLLRRAARAGMDVSGSEELTVDELKAEIKRRNEGRDDDAKIKPASQRKADLQAALREDDERTAG